MGLACIYFAIKFAPGLLANYRTTKDKATTEIYEFLNKLGLLEEYQPITSKHYTEVPYVDDHASGGKAYLDALRFSWSKYLPQVERDILLAKQ
jgi:hypothetical protein